VPRADVAILGVPFDTGVSYRPGAQHVAHNKSLKPLA
jgi:arginase family enzyme